MKKLTETFNQSTVAKGESFEIELPAFTGGGYFWEATVLSGKVQLLSKEFNQLHSPRMDGAVLQKFTFKAEETGNIEIRADHKRPWEKKIPVASKTFKITVTA